MKVIEVNNLTQNQKDDIWKIVCKADKEFVPPLSFRENTTQKDLNIKTGKETEPVEYFKGLLEQNFILAIEGEKVVGFLSYRKNHTLKCGRTEFRNLNYISTIIVSPEYRNLGLTKQMYDVLLKKKVNIATRTWSTNYGHIHILENLGFRLFETIENDRGNGIDTVYYINTMLLNN